MTFLLPHKNEIDSHTRTLNDNVQTENTGIKLYCTYGYCTRKPRRHPVKTIQEITNLIDTRNRKPPLPPLLLHSIDSISTILTNFPLIPIALIMSSHRIPGSSTAEHTQHGGRQVTAAQPFFCQAQSGSISPSTTGVNMLWNAFQSGPPHSS